MGSRTIQVRRVYEDAHDDDGARVLVDRVWPRGMKKEAARLDEWVKEIAPSTELRKWYAHEPGKFAEFRRSYVRELDCPEAEETLTQLREHAAATGLTLLTATKDVAHSHAPVLADLLTDS